MGFFAYLSLSPSICLLNFLTVSPTFLSLVVGDNSFKVLAKSFLPEFPGAFYLTCGVLISQATTY